MTDTETAHQLNLITWNVGRSSVSRLEDQLLALRERTPDIVALQEVGVVASRRPREILREHGFQYSAHSHEFRLGDPGNSSGIAFASRWPFRVLPPDTFDMPFQHQALSAEFFTPFGRIEGHSIHILPGSMFGEKKVEMFEAVYDRLATENPPAYRFLCGDFNSPKAESADGETTVWGSDDRWIDAERSVITGLADHDLADAYRDVHGYGDDAYSFVTKNQGSEWRRRFDHVFASEKLDATDASYLHQFDHLSDHTPLEVVFTPQGGLHDEIESMSRSRYEPSTESGGDVSSPSPPPFAGLTYENDRRTVDPDANYRRGRFKVGWNRAVDGAVMGDEALAELTWENLGWRLGMLFGEAPEELKEELYRWCVEQQLA